VPTIYDSSGNAREVSAAEYEQLVVAPVASGRQDVAAYGRGQHSNSSRLVLFDSVDGTETAPIDQEWAYRHYLRKQEWRCSACTFTSGAFVRTSSVESHVVDVFAQAKLHEGASTVPMLDGITPKTGCSACEHVFARGRFAQQHIDNILSAAETHAGAKEQLVFRYSLDSSSVRPPSAERSIAQAGQEHKVAEVMSESVVNQRERGRRRRHRSRGRRHKESVRA
jgi:hypothetical protein